MKIQRTEGHKITVTSEGNSKHTYDFEKTIDLTAYIYGPETANDLFLEIKYAIAHDLIRENEIAAYQNMNCEDLNYLIETLR